MSEPRVFTDPAAALEADPAARVYVYRIVEPITLYVPFDGDDEQDAYCAACHELPYHVVSSELPTPAGEEAECRRMLAEACLRFLNRSPADRAKVLERCHPEDRSVLEMFLKTEAEVYARRHHTA